QRPEEVPGGLLGGEATGGVRGGGEEEVDGLGLGDLGDGEHCVVGEFGGRHGAARGRGRLQGAGGGGVAPPALRRRSDLQQRFTDEVVDEPPSAGRVDRDEAGGAGLVEVGDDVVPVGDVS